MPRPVRALGAVRAPVLIGLWLLAVSLPALLGCGCGGLSLLPPLSRVICTPPPPVATPRVTPSTPLPATPVTVTITVTVTMTLTHR